LTAISLTNALSVVLSRALGSTSVPLASRANACLTTRPTSGTG